MRQQADGERYLPWSPASRAKVVREYEEKYHRISAVLDANPEILTLVDRDLRRLSRPGRQGRKAAFTSEVLLRTMIVHQIEGSSLRGTEVTLSHNVFLQDFVRLGTRSVPSFSFLDRCLKAVRPETWERVNDLLARYASDRGELEAAEIRVDTTVVESNIHYPTDSSLLWDAFRTIYRLLQRARKAVPGSIGDRFHDGKVKKLHLFITRYAASTSAKRRRKVRKSQAKLLEQVERIFGVATAYVASMRDVPDAALMTVVTEIERFLSPIGVVVDVARRVWIHGEVVPASERVFSIFEPHTELIKRGRRSKPVEFGHAIWLGQTRDRFITQFGVMEKKIPDCRLHDPVLEKHEALFGRPPEVLAADKGFRANPDAMAALRERVRVVAIPQRLKDFADEAFVALQQFRAGIEGSISVLKRAFRLFRCPYRGFKSFAAHIGLGVVCHNLVLLATSPP